MSHRLAFAFLMVALAMPGLAKAQSESVQQMRRIFAPPVQTFKKVFDGDGKVFSKSHPAQAPAKPRQPAAVAEDQPAADPAVAGAGIPAPRLRPDHPPDDAATGEAVATGETLEPDDAATTVVGLSEPIDFDNRFEPVAASAGEMTFAPAAPGSAPGSTPGSAPDTAPDEAAVLGLVEMPLPRPRAAAAAEALAGRTRLASLPPGGTAGSDLDCMRSLRSLGVVSVAIDPIKNGQCGIAAPTQVSALDGGGIALTTKATLTCRAAQTLANWMREEVEPAARQQLRGSVTGIRVAASYSCRTRNNIPGAKLSEHARGNAIDISAFQISGVGWVEVGGANTMAKRRFLAAVRKSACGPFTTVLGPGSDGYHKDHFHLDVIRRGKNGTSAYCH